MVDALAICAAAERHPTSARAGRAAAFLHGLRQGLRRGKQGVVGELHAVWVLDYQ
jgi:hypothetical protein